MKLKISKDVQRCSLSLHCEFELKVEAEFAVSMRCLKLNVKVKVWSCIWIVRKNHISKFEVDIYDLKKNVKEVRSLNLMLISNCLN